MLTHFNGDQQYETLFVSFSPNHCIFLLQICLIQSFLLSVPLVHSRRPPYSPFPLPLQLDIKPGNAMTLTHVPVGSWVHNIEITVGRGGQICRAAGTTAQVRVLSEINQV